MKAIIEVQAEELERRIRMASLPVLVLFHTDGCRPGRILGESLEALAREFVERFQLFQVSLDHHPELAGHHQVHRVPSLILFVRDAPVADLDPGLPPAQIKALLHGLLADYSSRVAA